LKEPGAKIRIENIFSSSSLEGFYINRQTELTIEFSNSGDDDSGSFSVNLYITPTDSNSNPILLDSKIVNNIAPSSKSTQNFLWKNPSAPGKYSIKTIIKNHADNVKLENTTSIYQIDILTNIPEVEIISPKNDVAIEIGSKDPIVFIGSAFDNEEGEISGNRLEWYSDINGFLGTGSILKYNKLFAGKHVITLKAKDIEGNVCQDTIRLFKPLFLFKKDELGVDSFTIKWMGEDTEEGSIISLYYDNNKLFNENNNYLIEKSFLDKDGLNENEWDLSGVTGGKYFIYAIINNEMSGSRVVYSHNKIFVAGVPKVERDALLSFYNSADGDNWEHKYGWGSIEPVNQWQGVDVDNYHVTGLSLDWQNISGTIPPELGNLLNLSVLSLYKNQLKGSIPSELSNIVNLKKLYASHNKLTGPIPPELGKLSSLSGLDLSDNQLTGPIPPELGKLSSLSDLDLSNNQLTGSIPSEIGKLSSLSGLDLSNNQLTGSIPSEIGKLSSLSDLDLADNQLTGSIPSEIGNLSLLHLLHLFNNQLKGSIPPDLGNLSSLFELDLSDNQLTGSIPPEIGNLHNLVILDLSNNQLAGSVPSELENLFALSQLSLNENCLDNLPNFTSNTPIWYLDISDNNFTFEDIEPNMDIWEINYLPQSQVIGETQHVIIREKESYTLSVIVGGEHNQYQWYKDSTLISGATKANYSINSISLTDTGGYHCRITNSIVNNLTFYYKTIIVIVKKNPSFTFTSLVNEDEPGIGFYSIKWTDEDSTNALISFYYDTDRLGNDGILIANNISEDNILDKYVWKLSEIPDGEYYIYAIIDDKIGEPIVIYSQKKVLVSSMPFSQRNALELLYENTDGDNWRYRYNWLNDLIKSWYGLYVVDGLVTILDLEMNNLKGTISHSIGFLYGLEILNLSRNYLSGTIPPELGNLTNLKTLFLHHNRLSGTIPPELGNLTNLKTLRLEYNDLTGSFPEEILNLKNIDMLSIQCNNLDSLPDLTSIAPFSYLNVAENNFTFEDLEPYIGIEGIIYSPQNRVGKEQTVIIDEGIPYTFSITVGGKHNLYQWYKDNVVIPEATEMSFTIDELSLTDSGEYNCNITNSIVTGLTLYSYPTHLNVNKAPSIKITTLVEGDEPGIGSYTIKWSDSDTDSNALISLYYDTDNVGQDGFLIAENISEDESSDEYVWDLSDVHGGEYYIYAVIDDGLGMPRVAYSQNKILVAGAPVSERDALIAIYESTNGDNWTNNSNWLSNRPIKEWHGVTVENGHVAELSLLKNNLIGKLPDDLGNL